MADYFKFEFNGSQELLKGFEVLIEKVKSTEKVLSLNFFKLVAAFSTA